MKRNGYLINTVNPYLATSNIYEVREGAVRLSVSGLDPLNADTVFISIEKKVGDSSWAPLYRNGQRIKLSGANVDYLELVTGIYRVVAVGVTTENVVVFFEEDEKRLDNRVNYVYNPIATVITNGGSSGSGLQYWTEHENSDLSGSIFRPKTLDNVSFEVVSNNGGFNVGKSDDDYSIYPQGNNSIRIKPRGAGPCGNESIVIGGDAGNGAAGAQNVLIGKINAIGVTDGNIALGGTLAFNGESQVIFNPGTSYGFVFPYGNAYTENLGNGENLLTQNSNRFKLTLSASITGENDNVPLLLRGETTPTVFSPGYGVGNTIYIPVGVGYYNAHVLVQEVNTENTWLYNISGTYSKILSNTVLLSSVVSELLAYTGLTSDPGISFQAYEDTGSFFILATRSSPNNYYLKADILVSCMEVALWQ